MRLQKLILSGTPPCTPHKHIYKHAERMHNMWLEYDRACLLSMLAYGSIDQLMYELKVKDVYKLNTDKIFHF